ncbi:cytochrome c oxidase assembly protein [Altererythrobacter salegens]|uniref:Cytochrome c oxidase assembly protein CtaG n=1 Tax=Croceibacterium salegens TaxID=1737568 RepID=A0A6I4SVY6_9SPHN|nr:cytochrome c oxidase assembly protein [Croceibacterium salegens]MXO60284.1 cytochrome c oxidase assembly protein [Croceibacterium salegens]
MASQAIEYRNRRTAAIMALVAAGMLALGFAAVPLYRIFCQVTGFAGTTQRATAAQAATAAEMARSAGGREISIRFDANTAPDLAWKFKPLQVTDTVTIGQRDIAIFTARNLSDKPLTGNASFNVEPEQAGRYFNKIQCFCFTEQTLRPGQEVRMPVIYYIDPAALNDPNMDGVEQITLSYTFHKAVDQPS